MVLGIVVVELMPWDDLSDRRGQGGVISQHRAFQFPRVDALLDQNLPVILRRAEDSLGELVRSVNLPHSNRRTEIRRFREHRVSETPFNRLTELIDVSRQVP